MAFRWRQRIYDCPDLDAGNLELTSRVRPEVLLRRRFEADFGASGSLSLPVFIDLNVNDGSARRKRFPNLPGRGDSRHESQGQEHASVAAPIGHSRCEALALALGTIWLRRAPLGAALIRSSWLGPILGWVPCPTGWCCLGGMGGHSRLSGWLTRKPSCMQATFQCNERGMGEGRRREGGWSWVGRSVLDINDTKFSELA